MMGLTTEIARRTKPRAHSTKRSIGYGVAATALLMSVPLTAHAIKPERVFLGGGEPPIRGASSNIVNIVKPVAQALNGAVFLRNRSLVPPGKAHRQRAYLEADQSLVQPRLVEAFQHGILTREGVAALKHEAHLVKAESSASSKTPSLVPKARVRDTAELILTALEHFEEGKRAVKELGRLSANLGDDAAAVKKAVADHVQRVAEWFGKAENGDLAAINGDLAAIKGSGGSLRGLLDQGLLRSPLGGIVATLGKHEDVRDVVAPFSEIREGFENLRARAANVTTTDNPVALLHSLNDQLRAGAKEIQSLAQWAWSPDDPG